MIYCETGNKLLRDGQQTTLMKSLYFNEKTPILKKSLLVFYYYYKERKNNIGFNFKRKTMFLRELREKRALKTTASKKNEKQKLNKT